ncbi:hypothetical protein [Lacinutrix salivirga]
MKTLIILIFFGMSILSFGQSDKLILTFNEFTVLKDTVRNTFKIKDQNNKIVKKELKYVNYAGYSNSLQILDGNYNLMYFDENLKQIEHPENEIIEVCGTVAYFKMKIIENNENYLIEFTEDKSVYSEGIKKTIIDTIAKVNIKDIYFANSKKEINYDENFDFPTYLILDLGNKFGIKQNDTIEYYDSVDLKNPFAIKVQRKNLFGYYGITEIKFKELNEFKYNLAKFKSELGKKGFIDNNGNEY